MPKLTRCTACGTTFRVTEEQLASHAGKVRCGSCGTVFNGIVNAVPEPLHLARTQPLERLPSGYALQDPIVDDVSHALTVPDAASASIRLGVTTPEVHETTSTQAMENAPVSESESPLDQSLRQSDDAIDATLAPPAGFASAPAAEKSNRARPWWTVLGIVVAVGALSAQAAHRYHHELTAYWPSTQPWMHEFCRAIPCSTRIQRDSQAISIESSDLQADPANRNLLTLVALLRNRALLPQDSPHLELTLTDAQDAVVARRVLPPREYMAGSFMAAGSELSVRLSIDASQIRASGYRLYAFYP